MLSFNLFIISSYQRIESKEIVNKYTKIMTKTLTGEQSQCPDRDHEKGISDSMFLTEKAS